MKILSRRSMILQLNSCSKKNSKKDWMVKKFRRLNYKLMNLMKTALRIGKKALSHSMKKKANFLVKYMLQSKRKNASNKLKGTKKRCKQS